MLEAILDAGDVVDDGAQAPDDDLLSGPLWSRHPADVVRVALSVVLLAVSVGLSVRHPHQVRLVSVDVVDVVSRLPAWVRLLILGAIQLTMVAAGVVLVTVAFRRPARMTATALTAGLAAAGAMAALQEPLDIVVPNRVVQIGLQSSWLTGAAFPSGAYISAFVAIVIVMGPTMSTGWRKVTWGVVVLVVVLRVVTAAAVPLNLVVTLAVGLAVGSMALVVAGSPRRTASRREVLAGLASAGFPADRIVALDVGANHSRTFLATVPDGRSALVKLAGRDERDAYLIQRLLKTLRVKGLADTRTRWSVGDLVRHEALSTLVARRRGVHTPDLVAVGTTRGGDGLLVFEPAPGVRLAEVPGELLSDDILDLVWAEVIALHSAGIAHRWLSAEHILVEVDAEHGGALHAPHGRGGSVHLIDFRWAVQQADSHQLGADVATLVTSLALSVGAQRAVAAAARSLPVETLAQALPLVQRAAMPTDLGRDLAGAPDLLEEVRDLLGDAAGGIEYAPVDLERIKPGRILGVIGGGLFVYTLLSFATSWHSIASAVGRVPLAAFPELLLLSFLPWVFSAALTVAIVLQPLPFGQVCLVMMGQTFMNRFTPANTGGMALRIRYLQKRGVELAAAAVVVGISSIANLVAQVIVLVTFAVWAGSSSVGLGFGVPDADEVALALLVLLVIGGLVWLTPWGRRYVAARAVTTFHHVWSSLRELAARPGRFVVGMTAITMSKFVSVVTFAECCRAIGIATPFPKLGLLYLTAATLASAAPTPGGVGAVEAALTAALTGVRVPAADALSAVFLFRMLTYWLPVPFSYLALRHLQAEEMV